MIRYDEIMIGDYVLVNGVPRKVEAVTKKKIGYYANPLKLGLSYSRLCECHHVILTRDLMLKNDFIMGTDGVYRKIEGHLILKVRITRKCMHVSIDTLEAHPAILLPFCCYIDPTLARLQQVLKIHGYNKLFKIEP